MKIEVIASTLDDAMKIEQCGGDRIELIMGFEEDGLTPSMALIELVTKRVKIPVNVMVRPHAKSFVLNKFDVEVMKREIEIVKNTDANGIVIGGITVDNEVDVKSMEYLLQDRGNLDVTFHACSNYLNDFLKSLKELERLNVTNILTKGGQSHIMNNLENLKKYVAESEKINILVGGNITFDNVEEVVKKTGAKQIHIGTAARIDNSRILGVDEKKLTKFIQRVRAI
ncbi:MAG: copper homeostasis protein CutC [Clostridia bacterium]